MAASKIIKALPLIDSTKRRNRLVLDTDNVTDLKVMPGLTMLGHKDQKAKEVPKVGSIVAVKGAKYLKRLVVIEDNVTSKDSSNLQQVFAATNEYLTDNNLVQAFLKFMKENQLTIPRLNTNVTVVQGYHYGIQKGKPFVNTTKPYNFKVTNLTRHFEWMKVGDTAKVLTQKGVSYLVISRVFQTKGRLDRNAALALKPVVCFHNYGISNKWIANLYRRIMKKRNAENK